MSNELAYFSINIALLRKAKGWSQQELAKRLHTGRTTISNWEKGVSFPLFVDLIAIVKVFGITLNDLVAAPRGVVTYTQPKLVSIAAEPATDPSSSNDLKAILDRLKAIERRLDGLKDE